MTKAEIENLLLRPKRIWDFLKKNRMEGCKVESLSKDTDK